PGPATGRDGADTAPRCGAVSRYRLRRSVDDLVGVVLDHRVGQQLAAHLLRRRLGLCRVALREIELDILALPDVPDAGEAQHFQRMVDGLALRVENAVLQRDMYFRLHRFRFPLVAEKQCSSPAGYCITFGPFMSVGPPSGRMPRRRATS